MYCADPQAVCVWVLVCVKTEYLQSVCSLVCVFVCVCVCVCVCYSALILNNTCVPAILRWALSPEMKCSLACLHTRRDTHIHAHTHIHVHTHTHSHTEHLPCVHTCIMAHWHTRETKSPHQTRAQRQVACLPCQVEDYSANQRLTWRECNVKNRQYTMMTI